MDTETKPKKERVRLHDQEVAASEGSDTYEGSERSDTLSSEQRRKVVSRIKKLLATAIHAGTEADEVNSAMQRVREMLAKYKLTFDDLDAEPSEGTEGSEDWEVSRGADQWPEEVDGYQLVKDLRALFRRHVKMTHEQTMACALWVLHAHAHDASQCSPILTITAPLPECGKTQLLDCLEYLVPRPYRADNATAAAIFTEIEKYYSTILIDEADTFINEPRHTEMRGIINSGHRRGKSVRRKDQRYSTWAPKAIALNGHLHHTLESRSIIIRLDRKRPDEVVESLREPKLGDNDNKFVILNRKCARWAADNLEALRDANPDLPSDLGNRTGDKWGPLLAIADLCRWPNKAREYSFEITRQSPKETPLAEELIRELRKLFDKRGSPLSSSEVVAQLVAMEARPWSSMPHMRGAALTTTSLAALLKPFRVLPGEVKTVTGRRAQGYRVEQFTDIFERYGRK